MVSKKIKLLFCIPWGILLFYTIYLLSKYNIIPDIIPIHGYHEKADIYGSKIYLFLTIGINVLLLIFIGYLIKNPQKVNQPFDITDNNKDKVYQNIQIFLICTAIIITIIFCYLFHDVVY